MPHELLIQSTTHGRVLIEDARDAEALGVLVAFHGYGESADDAMAAVRAIRGAERWKIVAPQALHRFYTKGDRAVVASWMTRQDRESAIADNVAYVDRVLDAVDVDSSRVVMLGFSQGASMAYRAAMLGRRAPAGIVALAGDIPPDVRDSLRRAWPPVLVGCGDADGWYRTRVDHDVEFLTTRGVIFELVRFAGGHEWTDAFRDRVATWLDSLVSG